MRVSIPDGVFAERVGDETVLLELQTGQYFGLNPVATRLWQLLGELGDTTRVLEVAAREYAVDRDRLTQDLDGLVADLLARRLLSGHPGR
jgi:hypothetical protein